MVQISEALKEMKKIQQTKQAGGKLKREGKEKDVSLHARSMMIEMEQGKCLIARVKRRMIVIDLIKFLTPKQAERALSLNLYYVYLFSI